jgi:hypothetical protein
MLLSFGPETQNNVPPMGSPKPICCANRLTFQLLLLSFESRLVSTESRNVDGHQANSVGDHSFFTAPNRSLENGKFQPFG